MATKFLEPGGDATFNVVTTANGGFWGSVFGTTTVATDFVHGNHIKSIKYAVNNGSQVVSPTGILADSGSRISFYIYLNALPSADTTILFVTQSSGFLRIIQIKISSAGVLKLFEATNQIGSDGSTLSTGTWYRICLAYTITNTTNNRFELFKDGLSDISVTNATITNTTSNRFVLGNDTNLTLDLRSSDHYVDDSNSLTDPGDIWVTAKRPNANGTSNNFSTQIGSGGSGYGSGHSPQVNERALSTTNGWSIVAVGVTTEEYNIESKATGDIDISAATIVDYMGWVYTKALIAETGQIILNNVTTNISITTSNKMFTAIAGSSTYPAGTGTDIGENTDSTATTVSLFECGVVVAYIPSSATTSTSSSTSTSTTSTSSSTSTTSTSTSSSTTSSTSTSLTTSTSTTSTSSSTSTSTSRTTSTSTTSTSSSTSTSTTSTSSSTSSSTSTSRTTSTSTTSTSSSTSTSTTSTSTSITISTSTSLTTSTSTTSTSSSTSTTTSTSTTISLTTSTSTSTTSTSSSTTTSTSTSLTTSTSTTSTSTSSSTSTSRTTSTSTTSTSTSITTSTSSSTSTTSTSSSTSTSKTTSTSTTSTSSSTSTSQTTSTSTTSTSSSTTTSTSTSSSTSSSTSTSTISQTTSTSTSTTSTSSSTTISTSTTITIPMPLKVSKVIQEYVSSESEQEMNFTVEKTEQN